MGTNTHHRIERLAVNNFQSIPSVNIDLGDFTVLVGPSNSGKSALLRALRAVVRNVNSPSAVRVGKTVFTSAVEFGDTTISIERGKSQSTYRIAASDGREEVYTKAGRTVPEDVQGMLGLPLPEDIPDIVFSSQIDPPFLLAETGSTAAKILGDLTNVSKLHEASREANRRRLEFSKIHKIRSEDAAACAKRMQDDFGDLHLHASRIKESRNLLDQIKASAKLRDTLTQLISMWEMAEAAEKLLKSQVDDIPEPVDIEAQAEHAGTLLARKHILQDQITTLMRLAEAEESLLAERDKAIIAAESADEEYRKALISAGTCPTCGQGVSS